MAQPTITGVTLNAGSGGSDLAVDVVDSKLWQAILVGYSTGDGTASVVMADTGLPVVAQSGATWSCTQSGTWNVTNVSGTVSLPTGASTAALQGTANTALAAIQAAVEGTLTVGSHAVTGPLTNAELRASAVPVSLASVPSHAVTNAGTFAVQVTSAPSIAVTGPLTDTELRATAVPVSGTFWQATQPVSLASVPSHAVTNAGTFAVQAAQSGTWTVDLGATDNAVLDDIAANQTDASQKTQLVDGSGNVIAATANALNVAIVSGAGSGGTASDDGADFTAGTTSGTPAMGVYESSPTSVTDGDMGVVGLTQTRAMRVSVDNTVTVASHAVTNAGTFAVQVTSAPTTAVTGPLTDTELRATAVPVSGTFWQATQPVSAASLPLPTGAATETTLAQLDGKVTACNTGAVAGTVTANLSAIDNAVLDDIAAKLATIDADTSVLATAVATEYQVDVVGALPAGTNAIGKLAANSGVDIGDVDVTSIAAGTNTIGGVIGQQSSSTLYDGTTACTVKRVSGVAAGGAPGTDTMIAAVVGKKFRILALFLKATSATANNVYLSTTTDTDVLGNSGNPIPLAVDADGDNDSGFVLPWNPGGWTETSTANEALILNTSAAQDIVYAVTYIEVA